MNSPDYSGGLKVCPQDYSVHRLDEVSCQHCGWLFSNADIQPTSALKACPSCNAYAGFHAQTCMNCRHQFTRSSVGADPVQPQPSYSAYATAYPRPNLQFASVLPPDVCGKFNWGAFMFNWIWGLNHRKPETLLVIPISCIPLGGLAASIYIGFKGNEWAWQSGRFQTVGEMLACQAIWTKWAVWFLVLSFAVPCFFAIFLPLIAQLAGGHH